MQQLLSSSSVRLFFSFQGSLSHFRLGKGGTTLDPVESPQVPSNEPPKLDAIAELSSIHPPDEKNCDAHLPIAQI